MNKIDLMELLTPVPFSEEEQALRDWIKLNKETLECRTPDEAVYFAVMNGFSRVLAQSVFSSYKDALTGSRLNSRAKLETYRLECAIEDSIRLRDERAKVKELDLKNLWADVHAYQTGAY